MLDDRKQKILRSVISTYIATGEPVGSKALMDMTELHVSSATIRSEMLELERLGLLCKPHTSAGRIPSEEGLRYYVQALDNSYQLDERDLRILVPAFGSCVSLIEMIKSDLLSKKSSIDFIGTRLLAETLILPSRRILKLMFFTFLKISSYSISFPSIKIIFFIFYQTLLIYQKYLQIYYPFGSNM